LVIGRRKQLAGVVYNETSRRFREWHRNVRRKRRFGSGC
jgi:hypothetical protein